MLDSDVNGGRMSPAKKNGSDGSETKREEWNCSKCKQQARQLAEPSNMPQVRSRQKGKQPPKANKPAATSPTAKKADGSASLSMWGLRQDLDYKAALTQDQLAKSEDVLMEMTEMEDQEEDGPNAQPLIDRPAKELRDEHSNLESMILQSRKLNITAGTAEMEKQATHLRSALMQQKPQVQQIAHAKSLLDKAEKAVTKLEEDLESARKKVEDLLSQRDTQRKRVEASRSAYEEATQKGTGRSRLRRGRTTCSAIVHSSPRDLQPPGAQPASHPGTTDPGSDSGLACHGHQQHHDTDLPPARCGRRATGDRRTTWRACSATTATAAASTSRSATDSSARTATADATCCSAASCWPSPACATSTSACPSCAATAPSSATATSTCATAATASTCRQRKGGPSRAQPTKRAERRRGCHAAAATGLIDQHGRRCGMCESVSRCPCKYLGSCNSFLTLLTVLLGNVLSPFWQHVIADCPSYPRQTSYAVRHHVLTRLFCTVTVFSLHVLLTCRQAVNACGLTIHRRCRRQRDSAGLPANASGVPLPKPKRHCSTPRLNRSYQHAMLTHHQKPVCQCRRL